MNNKYSIEVLITLLMFPYVIKSTYFIREKSSHNSPIFIKNWRSLLPNCSLSFSIFNIKMGSKATFIQRWFPSNTNICISILTWFSSPMQERSQGRSNSSSISRTFNKKIFTFTSICYG